MSNTSNVLKTPAGTRYERGRCEQDPQGPQQRVDKSIRVPKNKARVARDKFVRNSSSFNPGEALAHYVKEMQPEKKPSWFEKYGPYAFCAVAPGICLLGALGGCTVSFDVGGGRTDAAQTDSDVDSSVDSSVDGTTPVDGSPDADAEVLVDDQPTITWPYLNTLPNNRAFVRWNPPLEIAPGKTIVGYEISWSDGSNNYSKEVTFPFTAIDILNPNTMYNIRVRAKYNDASYGQDSTQVGVIADTSLLARYTMDEGAGNFIMDSSVNDNHGMLVNFDPLTAWTQGIIGTGLLFDGVDSYVNTGDTFNFDSTDPFTIEAWVQRGSVGTDLMTIFGRMDRTDTSLYRGYLFGFWNTNELRFSLNSDSLGNNLLKIITTTQFNTPSESNHLALTYDGSILAAGAKIYADSAEQPISIVHDTLSGTIQNAVPSRIGAAIATGGPVQDATYVINGAIDDLAIYEHALSADEVLNNNCAREALHSEEIGDANGMPAMCN